MNPEGYAVGNEAKASQCDSGGVLQGGFVTGWVDAAMAYAPIAMVGDDVVPMTLKLKISFFAPARPGTVFAEGLAIKHGRRTALYEGALKDASGTLLAKATSIMTMMERSKVEAASKAASGA